jgi:hypothetical protein
MQDFRTYMPHRRLSALQIDAVNQLRDVLLDGRLQCVDALSAGCWVKSGSKMDLQGSAAPRIAQTTAVGCLGQI